MKRIIIFFSFFVVLCAVNKALATSKASPESITIGNVVSAMQLYERQHEGRSPTNWAQVAEILDLKIPLYENYVFVFDKISVPGRNRGDVFLIRTEPTQRMEGEETLEGRYIISRCDGILKFNWMAETDVQKMLAAAGITKLPKPEPWGPPTNSTPPPQTKTNPKPVRVIEKPTPSVNQAAPPEPVTPTQTPNPVEPSSTQPVPAAQTASSSVFPKALAVICVLILGAWLAFMRLRSKK